MSLIVPEYVLAQRNAKKKAEEEAKKLELIERIPQPTGWRILVMPYMGRDKTEGGVYVPDPVREREARATVTAYVAKVGPLAYKDIDKFGEDGAWCKEGDWVCIGRYAGSRFSFSYWIRSPNTPNTCLLYTSPSPRDGLLSRMPSSA